MEKQKEKIQIIKQHSQPLWLTNQYVNRPILSFILCLILFSIALFLTINFEWFALSEGGHRDWYIWDHSKVEHMDMHQQALEQFQKSISKETVY